MPTLRALVPPLLAAALGFASIASAGTVQSPAAPGTAVATDSAAVMEVVERLFDGMRARDGDMVASVFHNQARLTSTGVTPDGRPRVQIQEIQGFIDAVGRGGEPWNEPLFDTEVRVDGHLAHVWTFYRFYAGETFSHCGHNSIQLARTAEGWRIVSIADMRRTEACDP